MKQIMRGLFGLLIVTTAGSSQAPAQTFNSYNDTYLDGCYSLVLHTTDVPNPPWPLDLPNILKGYGKGHVGVACFDGSTITHTVKISAWSDVNGTVPLPAGPTPVNYYVTNSPGGGMGFIMTSTLGRFAFATNNVSAGLAHGFQLLKYQGAPNGLIVGGTAYYQGPSSASYTNSVLNGCYSYFGETSGTTKLNTIGADLLGVLCFLSGNVIRGVWDNKDGVSTAGTNATSAGSYSITNTPGPGMGTITFNGGNTFAIAVNNVTGTCPACVAGGFQFMLNGHTGTNPIPIFTGTAFLQQ